MTTKRFDAFEDEVFDGNTLIFCCGRGIDAEHVAAALNAQHNKDEAFIRAWKHPALLYDIQRMDTDPDLDGQELYLEDSVKTSNFYYVLRNEIHYNANQWAVRLPDYDKTKAAKAKLNGLAKVLSTYDKTRSDFWNGTY